MANIIWKRPDGGISITIIQDETRMLYPDAHAAELQDRGDIPADWTQQGVNKQFPATREFRDAWEFKAGKVQENAAKKAAISADRAAAAAEVKA